MDKKTENLGAQLKASFDTKIEIVRLSVIQKTAEVLAGASLQIVLALLFFFFFFFACFTLAAWVKELTGKESLGYLSVTLLFLLIAAILYLRRHKIRRSIQDSFIANVSNSDETDQ